MRFKTVGTDGAPGEANPSITDPDTGIPPLVMAVKVLAGGIRT